MYRDAVAKATRLPLPVLDGMLARYKDFLFAVDPITPADIATQQRVADYLLAAKVIPTVPIGKVLVSAASDARQPERRPNASGAYWSARLG